MSDKVDIGDKMHIYNQNQMIRGKLDIQGNWGESYDTDQMWTKVYVLPEIGAFVTYLGEAYIVTRTVTYQEDLDIPTITTICRITRIDDEGDDLPIPAIEVEADKLTLI